MKITQMIVVKGVGLIEVIQTCVYLLPYLLVFTLPMAATVGILLSLTRLSVVQEVTALKTAGLSYTQLLPPLLGFSWPRRPLLWFSRSSAVPGASKPPGSC